VQRKIFYWNKFVKQLAFLHSAGCRSDSAELRTQNFEQQTRQTVPNSHRVNGLSPSLFYRIRHDEFSKGGDYWFGNAPKIFNSKKIDKKRCFLLFSHRHSYTLQRYRRYKKFMKREYATAISRIQPCADRCCDVLGIAHFYRLHSPISMLTAEQCQHAEARQRAATSARKGRRRRARR
jgi:hypothetical protein